MGKGFSAAEVNVLVVESDDALRNKYMSICQMIKGARVYGCAYGEDAADLVKTLVPHAALISASLEGKITGPEAVKAVIKRYPSAIVAAVAEKEDAASCARMLRAGAITCVTKPVSEDDLLFTVKNAADAVRAKISAAESGDDEDEPPFYADVVDVAGYADVISMNKNIGSLGLKEEITGNLLYIRLFSFLYDFLIKSFLSDFRMIAGIALDARRIMAEARWSEGLEPILKSTAFYSLAEKYVQIDEGYFRLFVDFASGDFGAVNIAERKGSGSVGETKEACGGFGRAFASKEFTAERISAVMGLASEYAACSPVFNALYEYLIKYLPSLELDFNIEGLVERLDKLDAAVSVTAAQEASGVGIEGSDAENRLFSEVLRLMIFLHEYRIII